MEAIWTNVKDPEVRRALQVMAERIQQLAATDSGKGASLVSINDGGGGAATWTGTDLETILAEIDARLAAGGL